MPPERSDTRLLIGAGAAAVLAGVFVAVVLLLATSRADSPKTYRPFPAGPVSQLRSNLKDEGPFYYPDAFGGWNNVSSIGSYISGFAVLIFLFGVAEAFMKKRRAVNNPWGAGATTLEWTLSSPPPFHQFEVLPRIK